jgi:hypothetical protein
VTIGASLRLAYLGCGSPCLLPTLKNWRTAEGVRPRPYSRACARRFPLGIKAIDQVGKAAVEIRAEISVLNIREQRRNHAVFAEDWKDFD